MSLGERTVLVGERRTAGEREDGRGLAADHAGSVGEHIQDPAPLGNSRLELITGRIAGGDRLKGMSGSHQVRHFHRPGSGAPRDGP